MAEWNELDLGGVDAYAAAVKAGYTGTRQQWMTAMQDAEANGLKAEGYANGKQNGTAVESGTYFHDNAQYYKEQAEAAKTAAQAAQAAAESAAETDLVAWLEQHITNPDSPPLDRTLASSSSAAPADMVGDLKSAINNVYSVLDYNPYTLDNGLFEQGSVSNAGVYTNSTVAIRLKEKIPVKKGMILSFKAGTNCKRLGLKFFNNDGTVTYNNSWITNNNSIYKFATDTNLMIVAQNDGTASFSPSDFDANIEIQSNDYINEVTLKTPGMVDIGQYGYFDKYTIQIVGIVEEGEVTRDHSVTSYIPVNGGGSLLLVYELISNAYGVAFYNESFEQIGFAALSRNVFSVSVPDNTAYFRATYFMADNPIKNRLIYYCPKGYKLNEINVKNFGAAGDKITDDTELLQRLLDIGGSQQIPIYFPSGNYLVSSSLIARYRSMLIYGNKWEMYAGSRIVIKTYEQSVSGGTVVYPKDSNDMQIVDENADGIGITIKNSGIAIQNMQFIPNFQSAKTELMDTYPLTATGIKISVPSMDIDCTISGCEFRGCNIGVELTGHNAIISANQFVHCNTEVKLTWSQRYGGEQRDIMIYNNRFHSCGRNTNGKTVAYDDADRACIQFPDYVEPTMQREVLIKDNLADYCGIFVQGNIFGAHIEQNTAYLCRNTFIKGAATVLYPDGESTEISGNALFDPLYNSENLTIRVKTNPPSIFSKTGLMLSKPIAVNPGNLVLFNKSWGTSAYGHGLLDALPEGDDPEEDDQHIIDAISASVGTKFVIPEGVHYIRLTMKAEEASTAVCTIYESYTTSTQDHASESDFPIVIKNNKIVGAIITDYSPGYNILKKQVEITDIGNIVIDSNIFENGTDNVIELNTCDFVIIDGNKFINAPSYCEVIATDEIKDGEGKNYINMTYCSKFEILNNIAEFIKRHDGSQTPYVNVPVSVDGSAYQYDDSNKFDYAN